MVHGEGVSIHADVLPTAWVMALLALPLPVIGWTGMALLTIRVCIVVELCRQPGAWLVAIRALSGKMVSRTIFLMAGLAIWESTVVKVGRAPT
jgi:hypothetical protein